MCRYLSTISILPQNLSEQQLLQTYRESPINWNTTIRPISFVDSVNCNYIDWCRCNINTNLDILFGSNRNIIPFYFATSLHLTIHLMSCFCNYRKMLMLAGELSICCMPSTHICLSALLLHSNSINLSGVLIAK